MRFSLAAQALYGASIVVAAPSMSLDDLQGRIEDGIKDIIKEIAPALKLDQTPGAHTISHASPKPPMDAISQVSQAKHAQKPNPAFQSKFASPSAAQQCAQNPNMRFEWRDYSNSDRHALVDGIKCLMNKPPSGKFQPSTNRYEDLVRIHQQYAPNIHNNNKFLIWHRYFLWTFEQMLREECGFDRAFVFWDETKDAGHFAEFDMFSPQFFGSLPGPTDGAGTCIRDGCSKDFENYCLTKTTYPEFEQCWEYGPHGYGHNGIGSVMGDVLGSVGDPAFWMHHSYIDRVFRVWQNVDESRRTTISGTIAGGAPSLWTPPSSWAASAPMSRSAMSSIP
ncbi:uncharacterized protein PG998_013453 [Apiospora kogelbergensis]|uniref:uncharacterized protein n=1 Tax=Apiospora kogelbergensis TaxID=1337665 RepID=UPI003130663A